MLIMFNFIESFHNQYFILISKIIFMFYMSALCLTDESECARDAYSGP